MSKYLQLCYLLKHKLILFHFSQFVFLKSYIYYLYILIAYCCEDYLLYHCNHHYPQKFYFCVCKFNIFSNSQWLLVDDALIEFSPFYPRYYANLKQFKQITRCITFSTGFIVTNTPVSFLALSLKAGKVFCVPRWIINCRSQQSDNMPLTEYCYPILITHSSKSANESSDNIMIDVYLLSQMSIHYPYIHSTVGVPLGSVLIWPPLFFTLTLLFHQHSILYILSPGQ